MTRLYLVRDKHGERQLGGQALPLSLGGDRAADIVMPGVPSEQRLAHIAESDGHAYIQAEDQSMTLLHNHEILEGSRWLKSGDEIRSGDAVMSWTLEGDLVIIATRIQALAPAIAPAAETPALVPPLQPLPEVLPRQAERSIHRKRYWALSAVFALLLLAALFVLLATPVSIEISPPPARQTLHGFPPSVEIGGRRLALPGRYTLKASLPGFRPLLEDIDVQRGGLQEFFFQLQELPGRIRFMLQPTVEYRVFIDDQETPTGADGVTEITGGYRQLRIETDRYLPLTTQLQITGRGEQQEFSYELQPGWAEVQISSTPPGARVEVNGVVQGITPLATEIMAGQRDIRVSLEKYQTAALQHRIEAGTALQLDNVVLTPANGELSVTSEPPGATISLAGVFHGSTPATLSLPSTERHSLRLSKPGYQLVDRQIQLAPEELQQLAIKLAPEYGTVFISSRPADAALMIDGKPAGSATRRLRLTTRPHTLSFSKQGYVSQQLTVTPRSGVSRNIDVTLKTRSQEKAARQPARTSATRTTAAGQQLRLVKPAASFRMGSSRREAGRRANENPRLVQLSRPFYLSETEVTNAAYRRFKPAHGSGSSEGVSLNDERLPVVNISWDDAARYCNWLSKQEGLPGVYRESNGQMQAVSPLTYGYRLPTEAEWTYVARKLGRQDMARYPWSGQYPPSLKVANFADVSIADTLSNTVPNYNDGYRVAAPVGSFPAQSGGFHDLGGNVAEWMHDFYAVYPGMAKTLVTDPTGPDSGNHHVVRGSSWRQGSIAELRLSYRDYSREPRPDLGFRVARYAQ